MLNGIDISSHQGDIDLGALEGVDFVIVKATEGDGYVNPWCDPKVQWCIDNDVLWGFYGWIKPNIDPVAQADYFVDNCLNYFGHGIPCVDWEEGGPSRSARDPRAVNSFARRVHERTGTWPLIYSWNHWFDGDVEPSCGRWICNYPPVTRPGFGYNADVPETNGLVAIWQYASDGRIPGYDGDLDVNHFYGDRAAWFAYVHAEPASPVPEPEPEPEPEKGCSETVHVVKPGDTIIIDKQ